MKSAIFDLDGTLADTSGDLIAAANACFIGLGHGPQLDPVADMLTAFGGGRAMLRLGFDRLNIPQSAHQIDAQYPVLLDYYEQHLDDLTVLYDGVEDALVELAARGYALGVCTNKPEYLAIELIKRLGITHHFGALLGADTLPVRKPDPEHLFETIRRVGGDPKRSVLIGDTQTDRSTSQNANVPSVLVSFGPLGAGIDAMKPDALLHHYNDLPDLLDRLIP